MILAVIDLIPRFDEVVVGISDPHRPTKAAATGERRSRHRIFEWPGPVGIADREIVVLRFCEVSAKAGVPAELAAALGLGLQNDICDLARQPRYAEAACFNDLDPLDVRRRGALQLVDRAA